MIHKKKSFLALTVFHQDEISKFLNKIFLVFRKYKLNFSYYKKKEKKIKNTILRSPHVYKTARDQIELYSSTYYFDLSKENQVFNFFLFIFKKYNQYPFRFHYKKTIQQTVFLFFGKKL